MLNSQPVTHEAFAAFLQELLVSAGAWGILTALVLLRLRRIAILATAGLLIWFLVATAGAPYWVGIDPGVMLTVAVTRAGTCRAARLGGPAAGDAAYDLAVLRAGRG